MKTLTAINSLLSDFTLNYGYDLLGAAQRSEAWFNCKLGVLSASNAAKIVAKADSETRLTYMSELVAQVATGYHKDFGSAETDWGIQQEPAARAYYEFKTGFNLTELPFVFLNTQFREGASPDALVNDKKGAEIKCPYASSNYIKFYCADSFKSEWDWQVQYTMRILESEQWDFCQFDPRMQKNPMKIVTIERDEKKQKTFNDACPQFIHDMDKMLKKMGLEFGVQWKRLKEPA